MGMNKGGLGGLIEEVSRRLVADLVASISDAVEKVVRETLLGSEKVPGVPVSSKKSPAPRRRSRKKNENKKVSALSTTARNEALVAAVQRLGRADIRQIAAESGLNVQGIGASLYFLVKKGEIKKLKNGTYRA